MTWKKEKLAGLRSTKVLKENRVGLDDDGGREIKGRRWTRLSGLFQEAHHVTALNQALFCKEVAERQYRRTSQQTDHAMPPNCRPVSVIPFEYSVGRLTTYIRILCTLYSPRFQHDATVLRFFVLFAPLGRLGSNSCDGGLVDTQTIPWQSMPDD